MPSWARNRSAGVLHLCAGAGCNGCDIEVVATQGPRYDPERLGLRFVDTPHHADIILVTDAVSKKNKRAFLKAYEEVPRPNVVIAIGNCAISGEIFRGLYGLAGTPDAFIPVDVHVPGCPPRPDAIMQGIKRGLEILGRKRA